MAARKSLIVMGCGQSKINLYPRRNKNGGKGNSANKKSGAADKDADEEEGSAAAPATPEEAEDDPEAGKQILPLTARPPVLEISESQQDFFKMLDEKIEEGRDYDSSSETEVRIEHERRRILIDQWRSASQSTQSSFSYSSPPTPARRRQPRPMQPPDRHSSPGASRRCYRQNHEGLSPPPRRAQSAQSHHVPDNRQLNGDWSRDDPNKSPVKRPQSAGSNWKNNPKVAPHNQKPKKNEANEHQRTSNAKFEHISSSNQDLTTFQQSPAHSAKVQQPYIAQIVTYPMSQQVTPPSTPKYIAPPEEYQDPHNNVPDPHNNHYSTQTTVTQNQSHIYYIHGNTNVPQDIAQQRQQTAIHLQQYVAMKQAQQQMFTYLQRQPHTVFPSVDQYTQRDPNRMYEHVNEEYVQYSTVRPHSAPAGARQVPVIPGLNPMDSAHAHQMPMWSPMPQVVSSMGPWVPGQTQEMQYYPQSNFMHNMYRANSAGSAGTLTRYHKVVEDKNNVCQSINLVRQKPVGQIVVGGQDLTVCSNASDSPSPASVSTDSGVSPGNSVPSSKNSVFNTPSSGSVKEPSVVDHKNKKNRTFSRPLKNSKSLDSS